MEERERARGRLKKGERRCVGLGMDGEQRERERKTDKLRNK
jgi:hypothetical protein